MSVVGKSSITVVAIWLVMASWAVAQEVAPPPLPEYTVGLTTGDQVFEVVNEGTVVEISFTIDPQGVALFEGDIELGSAERFVEVAGGADQVLSADDFGTFGLFRKGNFKWSDGVVPYVVDGDLPNKGRIEDAIEHWQQRTSIRFVERTGQSDYLRFVDPGQADRCSSSVGRVGGEQLVRLGTGCGLGNAIHEIGHALGLGHEQSRGDRDDWVLVLTDNIIDGMSGNFGKNPDKYRDVGQYCYDSIMHYSEYAFSRNGLPTIVPKNPDARIGQRSGLSACDVETITAMYVD